MEAYVSWNVLFTQQEDDTVSLFVFGEEESALAKEAEHTNGVIEYDKVKQHHFPNVKSSKRHEVPVRCADQCCGLLVALICISFS